MGTGGSSLALQFLVVYTPVNSLFSVIPLELRAWGWIAVAFVAFLVHNLATVGVLDRTVGTSSIHVRP